MTPAPRESVSTGTRAVVCLGALVVLGWLCLQPIAPDSSVYLLHARTWLETGNRFIDSHDSKGPLATWLLVPFVAAFGATPMAAGVARFACGLACAVVAWRLLRRAGSQRPIAISCAALAGILPSAPLLWGDSVRPEVFAGALIAALLALASRTRTPTVCAAMGTIAAGCLFLKTLLVLPAIGLLAGHLFAQPQSGPRAALRAAAAMGAGAILAAAALLGLIASTDDLGAWRRQTIDWPREFRTGTARPDTSPSGSLFKRAIAVYKATDDTAAPWLMPLKIPVTLTRSALLPLLLLAAWRWRSQTVAPRAAWSAALFGCIAGELLKLALEYRRWMYPASGLVLPLLLAVGLPGPMRRILPALWACVAPLAASIILDVGQTFAARVRGDALSPYEALASALRPHYAAGESILVLDNNYSLLLALGTPRPPPVLPLHAAMVSEAERETLRATLEANPPRWLAGKVPAYSGIHLGNTGASAVRVRARDRELFIDGPYETHTEMNGAWARRLR